MSACLAYSLIGGYRAGLRSSSRGLLDVPRTRTKFGDRAFGVAGPTVWNTLPDNINEARSVFTFKRLLKTYLFQKSFPAQSVV